MICRSVMPARASTTAAVVLILALSGFVASATIAIHDERGTAAVGVLPAATPVRTRGVYTKRGRLLSDASAEDCLKQSISTVLYSCPGYNGTQSAAAAGVNGTQNMRDAMVRLLQSCVLGSTANSTATQAMRLLLPGGFIGGLISNLTAVYSKTTGIPVELAIPPFNLYLPVRVASIQNPSNESLTHEVWLVTPSAIGDGMRSGAFMDLSDLVLFDQRLQWQGLIPQLRSVGLVYNSKVVSLPLSSYSYQLFYRMDTFKANNWTVPRTWRQLADHAVRINGTNNMWGFCGVWGLCGQLGTNLIRYILASYHQTHGATQGWLLNPDNMRLMLDTPAMAEAMDILKVLFSVSPPDLSALTGCAGDMLGPMYKDACHMTINWGTTFKYASHITNAQNVGGLRGNLGVSFLPGSDRVLDRATHTLVPCDATRCPYATWSNNAAENVGLVSEWVNVSPGFESVLMPVNGQASASLGFYAFSVVSYLSRPEISDVMVFNPMSEVLPSRTSQLNAAKWDEQGYNLADATRYCAAHAGAMDHPNLHVQIRIPGASNFVSLFGALMTSMMGGAPTAAVAASAQARGWAILNTTYKSNLTGLRLEYWQSINKPLVPPHWPPPSPALSQPDQAPAADGSSSVKGQDLMIILSVVIPSVAVLFIVFFALRYHCVRKMSGNSTWRKPPGVSPRTTLLVSDIENSTSLWEELDASVMDASAKLHNACLRTLAAKHKGYESVWEGDSFIIAFGDPVDALKFSLAAQQDLMHLDWPTRLLAHPSAAEVWMLRNKATAAGPSTAQKGSLFGVSTGMQKQVKNPSPGTSVTRDTGFSRVSKGGVSFAGNSSSPPPTLFSSSNKPGLPGSKTEAVPEEMVVPRGSSSRADLALMFAGLPSDWTIAAPGSTPEVPHQAQAEPEPRGSGGAVTTSDAGISFHANTMARVWTLRRSFQAKWTARAEGVTCTTDATLAYRGLRVRLGFHAGGLTSSSDLRFNEASRRWVYTGVIRVAANAITSAGLGGHILMSSATAGLLGRDTNGLLRLLPADCHVFHMGDHVLKDMSQEPVGLLLALPKSLNCRLGLEQPDLRTMQCVGLGALDAPAPADDHAWGSWRVPVLVGLQVSGLSTLLAWNRQETQQAVGQLLGILSQELKHWRGMLSEDGLSAAADAASIPAAADIALAGLNKDSIIPGRVIAAFSSADDAVHWALIVRHCLLLHDWSDELMSHEMCEQVGLMPAQTLGPVQAMFNEVGAPGTPKRDPSPSMNSSRLVQRVNAAMSPSPKRVPTISIGVSGRLPETPTAHMIVPRSPSATLFCVTPPDSPRDVPLANRQSRFGGSSAANRHSPADEVVNRPPEELWTVSVRPTAGVRDSLSGLHTLNESTQSKSCALPVLTSLRSPFASSVTAPGHPPATFVKLSVDRGDSGSLIREAQGSASNRVFTSDAPMLCGLRVRLAVASGPAVVHVATRSSGRAVYRGGKGVKQLHKLLQQAHAGQVLVAGNVMQDAEHDLA